MTAAAQVRIVSEGTRQTTGVWVNGQRLEDVIDLTWRIGADGYALATIQVRGVHVDAAAEIAGVEPFPCSKPTHLYIPWDGPGCAACPAQPDEHPHALPERVDQPAQL